MSISLTSSFPLNNAVLVTDQLCISTPITFTISSSNPPIAGTSLSISINGQQVVAAGVPVGSRYNTILTPSLSTINASISFSSALDSFDSFQTINIVVIATDGGGSSQTSFQFRIEDTIPPQVEEFVPATSSINNSPNTPIFFRISDQGSGPQLNSLIMSINVDEDNIINGYNAILSGIIQPGFSGSVTVSGNSIDGFITKDSGYGSDSIITTSLQIQDEQNVTNYVSSFTAADIQPPLIYNLVPAANASNIAENTTIAFTIDDETGTGINLSSLNVKLNGISAISSGVVQGSVLSNTTQLLAFPSLSNIETLNVILAPLNDLKSAYPNKIEVEVQDIQGNSTKKTYTFQVRDYKPPTIEKIYPNDGYQHIFPQTDIRFKITEDADGYGINFASLSVEIDGYSVSDQTIYGIPVDGYNDDFIGRNFTQAVLDGYISTPQVLDGYLANLTYPGFYTTIIKDSPNSYSFIVDPQLVFPFNYTATVQIFVEDLGGNYQTLSYAFTTAAEDELITTAIPSTATYKNYIDGYGIQGASEFLIRQGVVFENNLPDGYTTTFYTTDGTMPRIDSYNRILGTTKVFTQPILINKEGINVLKYFSIDQAGNKESVKQDVYMIDIMPPSLPSVRFVNIIADIPFPTFIIPVDETALFAETEYVRILDDFRPPIITKILVINDTSLPQYLIVEDKIEKLKVSRNARVEKTEQPLNPRLAIDFDTPNMAEFFHIGSDSSTKNQADSVFEAFRILNKASTDEEILADFTLLNKGTKFFNQSEPITLTSEYSSLETQRANMPDSTLVLLDFDGNVLNATRQGELANNTTSIVDLNAATNDIIFKIKIKSTENVDRELLTQVITNFAPIDLNIIVEFEEID
jgi:hypothetical protein